MPDRGRRAVVLVLTGYNLVQNLWLPQGAYVPANLAATGGLLALARRYSCSWGDLGLEPGRIWPGIRWGTAGAVAAVTAATLGSALSPTRPYFLDERAYGHQRRQQAYRAAIRFPLGTALFEEVAFRGVVYAMWRRSGATPRRALGAAAIAFGLWHLLPARRALDGNPLGSAVASRRATTGVVLAGSLLTTLSSFGLSWLKDRSGSLVAPWLTHAAVNSAGYLAGVAAWERSRRAVPTPPSG
jgi:membrane protease YdiL (CAAX protease family)